LLFQIRSIIFNSYTTFTLLLSNPHYPYPNPSYIFVRPSLSTVELSHFHLLRSVGKGAFGKVRVVQHKKSKEIYALKYINKAKCIRMRAVENIIQERRLLEEVEFSLICNLRYAFQDDENLFMVLDLMLGGDLRFHLERAGPMKEDVVKFYVAELALALDALHSRRIIHRYLLFLFCYGYCFLTKVEYYI
jgi:serine/threonine protein kinase